MPSNSTKIRIFYSMNNAAVRSFVPKLCGWNNKHVLCLKFNKKHKYLSEKPHKTKTNSINNDLKEQQSNYSNTEKKIQL